MPRRLALAGLLVLAGCAGVETALETLADATGPALSDLWAGLPGADPVDCDTRFATYYAFGARDLACRGALALAPEVVVSRAPVRPFRSGPHTATAQDVDLDLRAGRQFGRYDPAFVRWVTRAAVQTDPAARPFVEPIYRAHVARSARVFWLAHRSLAADGFPEADLDGRLGDYAAYLRGGPVTDRIEGYEGPESVSTYQFVEDARPLLPDGEVVVEGRTAMGDRRALTLDDWEIREEASTALAFWLRRDADGTRDVWHQGLRSLLAAYDADWLASHR